MQATRKWSAFASLPVQMNLLKNSPTDMGRNKYLEIMNNPDVIPSTRFNFPTNFTMHKRPFWDDFLDWAKTHFREIFEEEFYKGM